jgi:alkylresorcinol/alkylpyrone synthase
LRGGSNLPGYHAGVILGGSTLPKAEARLCSIATAVPEHVVTQTEVAERTRRAFSLRMPEFDRIAPVFENAGIAARHSVRPGDWYEQDRSWTERTDVYLSEATQLFISAARLALERAGLSGEDVDCVVTVSSTGIATPSLETRAAAALKLRPDVARVPVFGLGCAGGVSGLSIAARLAEARPGSNVLLVAVELCSLAIRLDKLTKANIVALALFGDGAAAAVIRTDVHGHARITAADEYTWPDTLDIMGWDVDQQGFGVIFDRSIPPFATEHLRPAIDGILRRQGVPRSRIDRFICHPGGAKIIEAIETGLSLKTGILDHERAILARFGNMSAPTALFVLERVMAEGLPPLSMLMALGPGFTLSTLTLARSSG